MSALKLGNSGEIDRLTEREREAEGDKWGKLDMKREMKKKEKQLKLLKSLKYSLWKFFRRVLIYEQPGKEKKEFSFNSKMSLRPQIPHLYNKISSKASFN